MKRSILVTAIIMLVFTAGLQAQTVYENNYLVKVGDIAPDFTLTDTAGTKVKLSDFRGKNNVVLAFYVFAFTGG